MPAGNSPRPKGRSSPEPEDDVSDAIADHVLTERRLLEQMDEAQADLTAALAAKVKAANDLEAMWLAFEKQQEAVEEEAPETISAEAIARLKLEANVAVTKAADQAVDNLAEAKLKVETNQESEEVWAELKARQVEETVADLMLAVDAVMQASDKFHGLSLPATPGFMDAAEGTARFLRLYAVAQSAASAAVASAFDGVAALSKKELRALLEAVVDEACKRPDDDESDDSLSADGPVRASGWGARVGRAYPPTGRSALNAAWGCEGVGG